MLLCMFQKVSAEIFLAGFYLLSIICYEIHRTSLIKRLKLLESEVWTHRNSTVDLTDFTVLQEIRCWFLMCERLNFEL